MLTGVGSTLLVKETKQKTLEDLSNERQDSFVGGRLQVFLSRAIVTHSSPPLYRCLWCASTVTRQAGPGPSGRTLMTLRLLTVGRCYSSDAITLYSFGRVISYTESSRRDRRRRRVVISALWLGTAVTTFEWPDGVPGNPHTLRSF